MKQKQRKAVSLEEAFDLAEESVHLNVLLLIKLLTDPGQAGQNHVHEPVRPNLTAHNGTSYSTRNTQPTLKTSSIKNDVPTCGTSSSCVTLTKFSNMATIEGAAITWQLTRSDRKRT